MTDDCGTPGDKVWEVNLAFTVEKRRSERVLEAPLLDMNYGVGAHTQLKFEVPWVFFKEDGEEDLNGLGNTTLGLKWRFLDQERHGIDMSIYPQFEFNNPTASADRGLVEEGTELLLPLQLERGFGRFSFNPELGYTFQEEGEEEFLLGMAIGYEVIPERLDLLGEVHASAEPDFEEDELVFNMGTRVTVTSWLTLLASAGRSFHRSRTGEPELLLYFGFQFLFNREGGGSVNDRVTEDTP